MTSRAFSKWRTVLDNADSLRNEDPMVSIDKRMAELRHMAKPRRQYCSLLQNLHPDKRSWILELQDMSEEDFKKIRPKRCTMKEKFRFAARMVVLLLKCFWNRRRYLVDKSKQNGLREKLASKLNPEPTHKQQNSRSSLGLEMRLCLSTQPEYKDPRAIKKVLWLLRATKAFKPLFPAELEEDLARYVSYERYDDGRLIASQGHAPDRLYHVLSGRLNKVRHYTLSTGHVSKSMGMLTKGMTSDPEELERGWLREDHLVAKGQVEVLLLHKKAFAFLQHTTHGPPVDFLRSLDLFEDFPVEAFLDHSDAITYGYYGQGKIVIKDANRTPWLHVVKSGQLKVVRYQNVIDAQVSNEHKFSTPRLDKLGTGKYFSHAQAMLGVQEKQRKIKASTSTTTLPEILSSLNKDSKERGKRKRKGTFSSRSSSSFSTSTSTESGGLWREFTMVNKHRFKGFYVKTSNVYKNSSALQRDVIREDEGETTQHTSPDASSFLPDITQSNQYNVQQQQQHHHHTSHQPSPQDSTGSPARSRRSSGVGPEDNVRRRRTRGTLADINIPTKEEEEEEGDNFQPHSLWLTRERTQADPGTGSEREPLEVPERPAHLQLDTLNPGDVFGLDHLQPALASEAKGVSLLSDGAEVIRINKRFFLQNAGNNTMLKVETMYKQYISEDEARQALYHQETWHQYKQALWQRLVAPIGDR